MNVLKAIAKQKTLTNFVVYGHVEGGGSYDTLEVNGLPPILGEKTKKQVRAKLARDLKAYPAATYYAAWVVIDAAGVVVVRLEVDND